MFTDSTVLITGGGGSVGRALISRFLDEGVGVVRVFDNNEPSLSKLAAGFDDDRLRYLVGDIRDKERLKRAMKDIDIVVHTAAMKHVDICEYNPFEAVQTNAVGLQNVVDTAIDADVRRVVFTSSDKAVNPANTMGTTKLLGEKLVTAGNKYAGDPNIRFASVRLGNVINSSQSVIPLFKEQIREEGAVTLTDPRMTRFFLTYDDVADLVTSAVEKTKGGEIFVHKMPAVEIEDLAEALIRVFAPEYGYDPEDIEIEVVGRRLGETFHEEIMTERETLRTVENESLYAVLPETAEGRGYLSHDGLNGFSEAESVTRSTAQAETLSRSGIKSFLMDNDITEGSS
ncbi:SDR family NAD(P)-dependent oxidoreductase [Halobacterium salinarum]|uniref:SDR family NAD(P)-dependent oxidoreductase n=1 Tax=Halobacterium salinarum TaxID=2242 RepID=UPI00255466A6|nr:SDR family NAD(P)-dependent oxidoreductase [Halobacterium salinarum]MDL0120419.1 SDR family NAD(P)-dependent oxidoreductase [Halobacterium salinarum]